MNYSEQILNDRFEQLPEDVRKAIIATPWKERLSQISDKHNLHIDQAGRLGEETVIVMFGLEHPDNLIPNIAKHIGVSEEKAEAIAEDLNREIFLKVRESLKKIFEGENNMVGKMEEELNREEILREIEDKERQKEPPTSSEAPPQNTAAAQEITNYKPAGLPEIKPEQKSDLAVSPPNEIEIPLVKTSEEKSNDIFRKKMSGVANLPKETIHINEPSLPAKKFPSDTSGKKIDPYRERVG